MYNMLNNSSISPIPNNLNNVRYNKQIYIYIFIYYNLVDTLIMPINI
jgi:hypothetical protein